MHRLSALLLAAFLCRPIYALADSDGYFCAGRGYLAYETRWDEATPSHVLHVLSFSTSGGIRRHAPIPLDDFQVHGMSCTATMIELEGWSGGYSIDISDPDSPVATRRQTGFDPTAPHPLPNLGHWSTPSIIDLSSDGPDGEFQVVIARVSRPVDGGIEHYTIADLVWRHPQSGQASIRAVERLFGGIFLETVD